MRVRCCSKQNFFAKKNLIERKGELQLKVVARKLMKNLKTSLVESRAKINGKVLGLMVAATAATMPVMGVLAAPGAEDIFARAKTVMQQIYNGMLGITTAVGVIAAVIAAMFMMFSNNPRTVESSKSWLKRIAIAWCIINGLGLIVNTLTSLMAGAGYTFT